MQTSSLPTQKMKLHHQVEENGPSLETPHTDSLFVPTPRGRGRKHSHTTLTARQSFQKGCPLGPGLPYAVPPSLVNLIKHSFGVWTLTSLNPSSLHICM